jgi:hypothetical protein
MVLWRLEISMLMVNSAIICALSSLYVIDFMLCVYAILSIINRIPFNHQSLQLACQVLFLVYVLVFLAYFTTTTFSPFLPPFLPPFRLSTFPLFPILNAIYWILP